MLAVDPVEATMEVDSTMPQELFSPSARLQGLLGTIPLEDSTEFELAAGGLENLLASNCTWTALISFTNTRVAWMGDHVFVHSGPTMNHAEPTLGGHDFFVSVEASFGSPNATRTSVLEVYALPAARVEATNICTALLQLVQRSQPSQVRLESLWYDPLPNISGPAIEELLEQCPELELLAFSDATLDAAQCRALAAALSNTSGELHIRFHNCAALEEGTAALADLFRRTETNHRQGRVHYHLDHFQTEGWPVLAHSLRGNTSVQTIVQPAGRINDRVLRQDEFCVLAEALGDNQGLVKFTPRVQHINDENWTVLCQSFHYHPTLETLDLSGTFDSGLNNVDLNNATISDATKTLRCTCIVNLLRSNTVLRSVHLTREQRDENIWNVSIMPHLETRTYQPLVMEIKAAAEPLRGQLLGRALDSVKTKPFLLYNFLTGNIDKITALYEERREDLE